MYIQSALPFEYLTMLPSHTKNCFTYFMMCLYELFSHPNRISHIAYNPLSKVRRIHNALNGMISYRLPENSCKFNTYYFSIELKQYVIQHKFVLYSPHPTYLKTISPACSDTAGTAVCLLKTLRIFIKTHKNRIILPFCPNRSHSDFFRYPHIPMSHNAG